MPKKQKKNEDVVENEAIECEGTECAEATPAKVRESKMVYTWKGGETTEKLPPQAKGILNLIEAAGSIGRNDLVKAMEGVIVTRQPQGRILSYYQKKIEASGLVEVSIAE